MLVFQKASGKCFKSLLKDESFLGLKAFKNIPGNGKCFPDRSERNTPRPSWPLGGSPDAHKGILINGDLEDRISGFQKIFQKPLSVFSDRSEKNTPGPAGPRQDLRSSENIPESGECFFRPV